jgi:hypothetical protein
MVSKLAEANTKTGADTVKTHAVTGSGGTQPKARVEAIATVLAGTKSPAPLKSHYPVARELSKTELEALEKKYAHIFDLYVVGANDKLKIKEGKDKDKDLGLTMATLRRVISVADQFIDSPQLMKGDHICMDKSLFLLKVDAIPCGSAAGATVRKLHILKKSYDKIHENSSNILRMLVVTDCKSKTRASKRNVCRISRSSFNFH